MWFAAKLAKPGAVKATVSGEIGEVQDIAPGKAKPLELELKRGHYALICNMPGYYDAGLRSSSAPSLAVPNHIS